jgi:hypothetical protein
MIQHHHWSLAELEDMLPYEKQIYQELLAAAKGMSPDIGNVKGASKTKPPAPSLKQRTSSKSKKVQSG